MAFVETRSTYTIKFGVFVAIFPNLTYHEAIAKLRERVVTWGLSAYCHPERNEHVCWRYFNRTAKQRELIVFASRYVSVFRGDSPCLVCGVLPETVLENSLDKPILKDRGPSLTLARSSPSKPEPKGFLLIPLEML